MILKRKDLISFFNWKYHFRKDNFKPFSESIYGAATIDKADNRMVRITS